MKVIENEVNPEIMEYIRTRIVPQYESFDPAHRADHVKNVIKAALEMSRHYDVDADMVAMAAACHDLGLREDRKTHHLVSGRIIRSNADLRRWFTEEQIETIAMAAEDHRASSDHAPRSVYGRIIAEADRQIDSLTVIRRTVQYGLEHYPQLDKEGHWQRTLEHLHEKYADGGYLKLWIPESPNAAELERLRDIIRDEGRLRVIFEKTYDKLIPTALFTIASSLHRGLPKAQDEKFIREIEQALGEDFDFREDFENYDDIDKKIIYVRTGDSEETFRSLGLKGEIRLLTSGKENSLAAAMEILSYINHNGGRGEILHGSADYIASRIRGEADEDEGPAMTMPLPFTDLGGKRVGVIGAPSDWLISSEVDYAKAEDRLNVRMVDIPIEELIRAVKDHNCDLRSFKGSEAVYEELKLIAARYSLDALTLRCFDLLDSIGNTGCLALARLNAEGITSSCEGDIPALLTMMIAKEMTGCPGFQCNLSRISGDELLFAHCTVPLSMAKSYTYDTHFESGIGTAIKAELPLEEITIAKLSSNLEEIALIPGRILENRSEANLCRTQIVVKAAGARNYFLKHSFANHHVIIPGHLY